MSVAVDFAGVSTSRKLPTGFGLLVRLLAANWRVGALTLRLPNKALHHLKGAEPGPHGELIIHDYRFARRVLRAGDIGFAEGYMAGEWDTPNLAALLEALVRNQDGITRLFHGQAIANALNWVRHKLNRNSREGAKKNIHAHYDLGNAFYETWLDRTMTYSWARFDHPAETLEAAQTRKYRTLAEAMDLKAGHHVLEIGCGWGGFAEYAAGEVGARVTGITISQQQFEYARKRMADKGLADRVDIRLIDYRDVEGTFDRVASIEMFEAVGEEYWPTYFNKIREVLAPAGRAALQIITIQDSVFPRYRRRTDFIQKYIFPGGMLPSEAALRPIVAGAGLQWGEVARFGQSYADTLHRWDQRFQAAWEDIRQMPRFDERFRKLWRFYLGYCEAGFRTGRTDVIQLALTRP